jgi:hypothetical protein
LKRTKITTNKSLSFALLFYCRILKPTASLVLYRKWFILPIFSFVLITTLKVNIRITVKLNFELVSFQQIISLYNKYSVWFYYFFPRPFKTNIVSIQTSLDTAPYPKFKSLKPTASLKMNYITNIFFSSYYSIENENKKYWEIKYWTFDLTTIKINYISNIQFEFYLYFPRLFKIHLVFSKAQWRSRF